jgi:hypothetical protein
VRWSWARRTQLPGIAPWLSIQSLNCLRVDPSLSTKRRCSFSTSMRPSPLPVGCQIADWGREGPRCPQSENFLQARTKCPYRRTGRASQKDQGMDGTLAVRAPQLITQRIFEVISDHIARATNCHHLDCWMDLPSRRRARGQNRGAFAGRLWHRERGFEARRADRRYHQTENPGQAVEQAPVDDRRRCSGPDPRRRCPPIMPFQRRACLSQGRQILKLF